MYQPAAFNEQDPGQIRELIRDYPLATVVTIENGSPCANHLPILVADGPKLKLYGHMARANPQWKQLPDQEPLVIFNGPHAYITPRWYTESSIPTWSYAVVHARGPARLVEEPEELWTILEKTTARFEALDEGAPARVDLEEKQALLKMRAIVGFEIDVTRLEAKLKISQNRSPADIRGAMQGLASRRDDMSRGVLELMRRKYGEN